ncbi:cholecystokinin receptor-like [Sitophilus oryzae]|uniref:Cholecystokinin receptor-like n=1 Tax=Sitophilus oryzae TaxID=7048 RepID=A0A6J2XH65_SITOR|nr:cholecystokinin receptor-like [Sitophilus oryzae]
MDQLVTFDPISFDSNWSTMDTSNWTTTSAPPKNQVLVWDGPQKIQIPLYCIIFMLAVVGNILIILTLAQNRRMRTVTNLFLLNLAVSDLLLGVLCMPFTLIGALLRDFVFGGTMCKLIPFLQACTVSVGAWTLVAISVERYYAICHPLRSLTWQTPSHAYKTILAIWIGSIICMMPIALLSQLKPTKRGNHKCREDWSSLEFEKAYNIFLDIILMVLPLAVLALTYSLIICTLWKGIKTERAIKSQAPSSSVDMYVHLQGTSTTTWSSRNRATVRQQSQWKPGRNCSDDANSLVSSNGSRKIITGLRKTNAERSLCNKKRVIRMLCVVVMEFFVCWTPLYIINTIALFDKEFVYKNIGYTGIGFFQLLAYSSSCCNPITYCFMNCGFRKSFVKLFRCFKSNPDNRNFQLEGSDGQMDLKFVHNRCADFT